MASRRAVVVGGAAFAALGAWGPERAGLRAGQHTDTSNPAPSPPSPILTFAPRYIAARDGTRLRTAVFEAASPRGVCVLLSGQGEFIEKYVEVIGELKARGFTVATFDWRGQGGSARPLPDPLKIYVRDFAEYDDDLASFLDQVVKPIAHRPLVLAHSMGGHILLRRLHDRPGDFRAAALTAPMLALQTRGYPLWMVRTVPAIYGALGQADDFAWGMDRDPLTVDFDHQLCTSDRARYARTRRIIAARPSLRVAGPTWAWIAAAWRSMAAIAAPGYAEAIRLPALYAGAGRDRVARVEVGRRFAAQLPHAAYVELKDAQHEILMEKDSIRARFWTAFDAFTARLA
ncbi:MAG: alpha/beta hydrolase [Alphaproteobacteria bacterium]|nr:alpha/beta hydrolase [Alphaproteobacteria bacterium]